MDTSTEHDPLIVVLDPEIAENIDGLGTAVAARVWKATLAELPVLAQRISFSLQEGELRDVAAAAHTGKGSTGTIGLLRLSDELSRLIEMARAGDLEAARRHWVKTELLVALSVTTVAKHLWKI